MSLVHMYLKRAASSDTVAEYRAVTADVAPSGEWREVARVVIDKKARTYDFFPLNEWESERVVPPHLYALDEQAFKEAYDRDYRDYRWGGWTSRIHEWVMRLMDEGGYPEQAPTPGSEFNRWS